MNIPFETHGLNHAAIGVLDLKESIDFYTEILGFKVYYFQDQDWAMVSMKETTLSFVKVNEISKPTKGSHPNHLGITLPTKEDVDLAYQHLKRHDVKILCEPQGHRDESYGFYFKDPSGNVMEIIYIKF